MAIPYLAHISKQSSMLTHGWYFDKLRGKFIWEGAFFWQYMVSCTIKMLTHIKYKHTIYLRQSGKMTVTGAHKTTMDITIQCRINAPCVLADALVNPGGPEEHYRGLSAIFANFRPILAYFTVTIPSESAGGAFI